ncbi:MAG: DUF4326 domain-containing protein [Novosphingobium sp.]
MTQAQRIRLSRAKGFRLPANAVNVARPGRWGNPFVVGKHGTRAQCAAKFYVLARGFVAFSEPDISVDAQLTVYRRIRRHAADLAGHDLACWCALDGEPCHGDVLLMLANPGHPAPAWLRAGVDLPRVRLGMDIKTIEKLNRRKARPEAE